MRTALFGVLVAASLAATPLTPKTAHALALPAAAGRIAAADAVSVAPLNVYYGYPYYRPWRPYWRPAYGYYRPWRPYYRPIYYSYRPWRPYYRPLYYGYYRPYYRPYYGYYRPWRPYYRPVFYGGFRPYFGFRNYWW